MGEELCGFDRTTANRLTAALSRIEHAYKNPSSHRAQGASTGRRLYMVRATLTSTLSAGGSAGITFPDIPEADPDTVYDDILEAGESIASGSTIRVGWDAAWEHDGVKGCFFLLQGKCSIVSGGD